MKTFEVEVRYTSYTIITIEADSPEQAEELARQEMESDYRDWELESIEELKGESK